MIRPTLAVHRRRGYVLYIVLVVVVVLTLVAYQYQDTMAAESVAAVRAHELEQAKANAVSGVYHAAALLTDPSYFTYNLDDDAGLFSAQVVGTANAEQDTRSPRWEGDANQRRGGGRFSLINLSDINGSTDGSYAGQRRYGLEDEGRKLNLNALIRVDPTGALLNGALTQLPNMTPEVAGAIVDWLDADENEYPTGGAENAYYTAGQQPYRCKNGPIHTVEELLLVKGVTPELLFGSDRNRNGVQDGGETTDGTFSRGWSEYLTCYGREANVDSDGAPRVNLNNTDLAALDTALMGLQDEGMTREVADYILYYRISGTGEAFTPTLAAGRVSADVSSLRDLVKNAVEGGAIPRRRVTSPFTVMNTQIRLPAARGPNNTTITPVVASPLNNQEALKAVARLMADRCTASDDYELVPRVNVNTAPREVLACLKGLNLDSSTQITDADIDAILNNRPSPGTDPTSAWLVTTAGLTPAKYKNIEKFVTGRSGAFRVRSVGYFGTAGGPTASVEAVIEVVAEDPDGAGAIAKPRIAYFRDTTDLGRVFDDLPR